MILYKGYTYNPGGQTKNSRRWRCSSERSRSCKASVYTTLDFEFERAYEDHNHTPPSYHITSRNEISARQDCCNIQGVRFQPQSRPKKWSKLALFSSQHEEVQRHNLHHLRSEVSEDVQETHTRASIVSRHVKRDLFRVLSSQLGRPMLLFRGFTYSLGYDSIESKQWRCSSRISKRCKATLHTTKDLIFRKCYGRHTHQPPSYHVTADGTYIKL
ncbi:hypothetical protein EVAR_9192_1 [Eumeta japonica]|uniref:FLYWCH-type domain-containing protein n=1 Tax=Eumeta variegata TaxID=151549 RepID=A0A4C1WN47_EUMVA|nr:hypothetical protein EVAR_9192_1 [Eumeta japonica]